MRLGGGICAGLRRRFALPALRLLTGCGTQSDEVAASRWCRRPENVYLQGANIETRRNEVRDRRVELEQRWRRPSNAAGGDFVNAIVYRSEYCKMAATSKS